MKSTLNFHHSTEASLCHNRLQFLLIEQKKAGLAVLTRNESNEICSFKSNIDYFHPKKHIPPWKRGDPNISPCESRTFIACRSMQNIQMLCGSGGSCKYVCKYVAKIDKCNYMTVSTASDGSLIRRSNFLHNTKIVTSDKQQQKERQSKRSWKHPQGRVISLNEILHHLLKYPEVITDLKFIQIPTTSLALRTRHSVKCRKERKPKNNDISDDSDSDSDDDEDDDYENRNYGSLLGPSHGSDDGSSHDSNNNDVNSTDDLELEYTTEHNINSEREDLSCQRQFTENQIGTHKDIHLLKSHCRVDKITQFSLRPPEIMTLVDMVGKYFRWFEISSEPLKRGAVHSLLEADINYSAWIDGLYRQVLLRRKALPELLSWIEQTFSTLDPFQSDMVNLFKRIDNVLSQEEANLSEDDLAFLHQAKKHLLCDNDDGHLPIPVYSYIKPTMGASFILHVLLSMGRFTTERHYFE